MRLRDVEVICSFSGSNLFVHISYKIPSNRTDIWIDSYLGCSYSPKSKYKEHSFLMLTQGKNGASISLHPENAKERKAFSGFSNIQSSDYIGTSLMFTPRVTEKQFNKGYKATKC